MVPPERKTISHLEQRERIGELSEEVFKDQFSTKCYTGKEFNEETHRLCRKKTVTDNRWKIDSQFANNHALVLWSEDN